MLFILTEAFFTLVILNLFYFPLQFFVQSANVEFIGEADGREIFYLNTSFMLQWPSSMLIC